MTQSPVSTTLSGLRVTASEKFLTGASPAAPTCSVGYLLRK